MAAPGTIAPSLIIRCFGPLDVRLDGRSIRPLRTRKGLWLLALLTLRHQSNVTRDWLAETLWPDSEQEQAFCNLRRTLTDLRQAMGAHAQRLSSSTVHTLCLDLKDAQVDLLAFDAAIARGDPLSLQAAVALYAGTLLEGCEEEWVRPERKARELSCLLALERLAEQALQTGDTTQSAGYLRRVIAQDPLREGAQRGLLQALAAGGDYAAAVQVYRELRLYLRHELNMEPAAETRTLFEQLRHQERERARAQPQQRLSPTSVTTAQAPAQEFAALQPRDIPPNNLPAPVSSFIGRAQEIETLKQLLSKTRLLTLTGSGGCGKSRLALAVAEELLENYPDGTWLVELAALSDPALTPQAVAVALGVREEPGRRLLQTLVESLRSRKILLVLDNCEHLAAACAELVDTLLRGCPDLRVLATSREPLRVGGEQPWRVPPLTHPSTARLRSDEKELATVLLEYDGCRLFVERARVQQPEFALTGGNAILVAQLCERLDGIPLALELAASRLRALSLEQMHDRLHDRFRLLCGGDRTSLPHHQTLRALIDWSYDPLEEAEKLLLHRLAVFAGGWTLEAAEAVCKDEGGRMKDEEIRVPHPSAFILHPSDVLDLLTSLVDKSLVVFETKRGAGGRYLLLETIRQYAQERLAESGEREVLQRRHADYFLALAEEAEPHLRGSEQAAWLEVLETEHTNLRAVLAWSLQTEHDGSFPSFLFPLPSECGLRLVGALWRFWRFRGYLSEGRVHLAGALASGRSAFPALRAKALVGAGDLTWIQGDYAAARALFAESLSIYRELGDRRGIAIALNGLGMVAGNHGDYALAQALFEESLSIRRELGDRLGIPNSLTNLGDMADCQGNYALAQALYEESLSIFRELGDRRNIAIVLISLGTVAYHEQDYATARALCEECLQILRELGDRPGIAITLNGLGMVARGQKDYATARALYAESLQIGRELGQKHEIADSLEGFASLATALGKAERAARLFGAASLLRETVNAPSAPADRDRYDSDLSAARALLAEEEFAQAYDRGRAMTLEQAIELAMENVA